MDYKEFALKVKTKYPQYSDMDDLTLAQKMVQKYPNEYSDVSFDSQEPTPTKPKQQAPFAQRFVENVGSPFSQVFGSNPMTATLGKVLDVPMQQAQNLFQASGKVGTSLAENKPMGAVEGLTRAGASLASAPFLPITTAISVGSQALPEPVQQGMSAISNPFKSILGENDLTATADNLLQGATSGLAIKKGLTSPTKFKEGRMKVAEENVLRSAPPKGEVNYNIQEDLKTFAPFLKEEAKRGFEKGGQVNRQTELKINKSLQKFYETRMKPQLDRAISEGAEVDMTDAVKQMQSSVGKSDNIFDQAKSKAIEGFVEKTPKKMSISEADALLKDLNAKTKRFEEMSSVDLFKKMSEDPKIEAMMDFKNGLRDAIVQSLESVGEQGTVKLRQTYGSGARLRKLVRDNVLPAENEARQQTLRVGGRGGLFGLIEDNIARVVGNTKEGQMKRGVKRIGRYADTPPTPQVPTPELLNILYRNRYGAE